MKKSLLLPLAALLSLSACNKESNFETVGTYYVANLITPADESKDSYATSGEYSIKMVNNNVASIAATNLYIGGMSQQFTTGPLQTQALTYTSGMAGTVVGFSGSSGQLGSMPITDITGYVSGAFNYIALQVPDMSYTPVTNYGPLLFMNYNIGSDYSVSTFCSDSYFSGESERTLLLNGSYQTMKVNSYYRVKFNAAYTKADLVLYNVRFSSSQADAFPSVRLKDLDVKFSKGAYSLSGTDIVPIVTEDLKGVAKPEYTISNVKVESLPENLAGISLSYALANGECSAQFTGYCAIINIF